MYFNRLKLENNHISKTLFSLIEKKFTPQIYKKNAPIYPDYNGHIDSAEILFIKRGSAKSVFFDEGEEFILYFLEDKNIDIIGGTCTIVFLEDSEIYRCKMSEIFPLLKNADFSQMLLTSMIKKSVLERRIIKNLAFGRCKKKVAYFLVDIAIYFKNQNLPLDFDMSVSELAHFVGLKRQTVSSICSDLFKKDIIKRTQGKHFVINDIEKLKQYAQYDID